MTSRFGMRGHQLLGSVQPRRGAASSGVLEEAEYEVNGEQLQLDALPRGKRPPCFLKLCVDLAETPPGAEAGTSCRCRLCHALSRFSWAAGTPAGDRAAQRSFLRGEGFGEGFCGSSFFQGGKQPPQGRAHPLPTPCGGTGRRTAFRVAANPVPAGTGKYRTGRSGAGTSRVRGEDGAGEEGACVRACV